MFEIEDLKPDDVLIQAGNLNEGKVLFGDWLQGNWDLYADGYKVAADILVEQLEGNPQEDRLICPVLFMYRYFVELKLKHLILSLDRLSGTQISKEKFGKHHLSPLWIYVREHLDCVGGEGNSAELFASLGARIEELNQLDPDSMHFRYSHSKAFQEMAIPDSLSMSNLKGTMNKINNAFGLIEAGIDYEMEGRAIDAELEAEMRAESY